METDRKNNKLITKQKETKLLMFVINIIIYNSKLVIL